MVKPHIIICDDLDILDQMELMTQSALQQNNLGDVAVELFSEAEKAANFMAGISDLSRTILILGAPLAKGVTKDVLDALQKRGKFPAMLGYHVDVSQTVFDLVIDQHGYAGKVALIEEQTDLKSIYRFLTQNGAILSAPTGSKPRQIPT